MYKFKPYGPFEVPVEEGRVYTSELREFWNGIETDHPGLQNAVGCYIFATHAGKSPRPWYVGKTERASFRKEAFQPQKLLLYEEALRKQKRGTPLLYLIARLTTTGKFRGSGKGKNGVSSIGKLEGLLIGASLLRNPKLVNKKTTKHLLLTQVPGYMNETPGARTREARDLALLLGTKSKVKAKNAQIED
jgi:hypothetical protein